MKTNVASYRAPFTSPCANRITKSLFLFFLLTSSFAVQLQAQELQQRWWSPPEEARPWVFWYWMQGAVSPAGITADLEAMKAAGLGGAYLMPIKGVPKKPWIEPIVEQLSPLWWEMVDFAFREADRLGLKIGFHVCDGFALAGGPWITPERSMQKVVWSQTTIQGEKPITVQLPQPKSYPGYYEDIAVFAYPSLPGEGAAADNNPPTITTNAPNSDARFLANANAGETFRSDRPCWIQFSYDEPFTCRSLQIQPAARNLQSQRLIVETGNDGIHFTRHTRLEPPRQGWQNDEFPLTYSIPPVTARYFRLLYDPEGIEPGAEDLDAAKWKQSLRIRSIRLSSEARIHQYEGKNGSIWRVSPRTTSEQLPESLCIDPQRLIDLSQWVDASGVLRWKAPAGHWTILRMGHTSTGLTNATGGKGSGLECDKFNPEAIRLQFNSWFGKAVETAGEDLAARVLKIFHVDSWECSSQNWSPVFRSEFQKRRGYDIYNYLPVMAGIPIGNAETSENILYDVRQTIAELITEVFYQTLQEEAHAKGCVFSAESVAPTMSGDGMLHYQNTDIPMSEFWLQSPTHDKPNDRLDAISGAHIYGKNIIQTEAFTQLRSTFTEHPEMLKTLQDQNYALGINRLVYHVYVLNPWEDRKPGMTLDGIGLYFQRDQTWWKQVGAWVDYARRCQTLLQAGRPVVDLAVFTGDELPRRALTPDRLLPFIPGIFGAEKTEREKLRLANAGVPTRQMPAGVSYSANMFTAEDWINPLRGYAYDSFHPDALAQAKPVNGVITLPSGMTYQALLVPGKHPMQPNPESMTQATTGRLAQLEKQGATVIRQPYTHETFDSLGIERDFIVTENTPDYASRIAYTHRREADTDIYFVSNQENRRRELTVSLRVGGKIPELWYPVTGDIRRASNWKIENGRTTLPLRLDAGESVFIVLQQPAQQASANDGKNWLEYSEVLTIASPWTVQFDPLSRGPELPVTFPTLIEWNEHPDESIRYYSGSAIYSTVFDWDDPRGDNRIFLELDSLYNVATVTLNGKDCGTIWTKPYRLNIASALKRGKNTLKIEVSNTWANRIMGDEDFNAEKDANKRIWTNAPYRLAEKRLVASGLSGNVKLVNAE
ncbi:MAG: DNA-binding protein [Dysgonamonadaceae bacterium]|nr:DNA-binding protein [Dysgonamonadaceae bacterium]